MKDILIEFNNSYVKLSEKEELRFKILVNKLINVNYLTSFKEEDKSDYYFIYNNLDCFKAYFSLGGRELKHYKSQSVFVLESPYSQKQSLSKISSLVLLLLRLLYVQKLQEISLENSVNIILGDIQEKYEQLALGKVERLSKKEIEDSLKIFRKNNLIIFRGNDFQNDDFVITILPTIQYVININDIDALVNKINSYLDKEDNYEEVN